ncbi:penicillin-binding protein 1C [Paraliomyxa miuraensis]|uniref:penicillin-binding protein 1C n=1 Tax=Paraliomyxa miuraensis TaxID=376150 RepID=UPI002254BE0C|nr:penicillin-binding protein 1C [Paraliomyxa miuraensis]MCX4244786.1 penicillin-binding protein 1C [Paraliomyxa miuraensis]
MPRPRPLAPSLHPRASRRRRRRVVLGALVLLVGVAWLSWAALWAWLRQEVGRPDEALADDWYSGHRVLDREGRLLRELPGEDGRRGRAVSLSELGDRIVAATVVSEDARFFEHDGIDEAAMVRAAGQNLRHGRVVSGASTITQQLVKLLDTRGKPGTRTPWVKLREAARAANLDEALAKEEILQAYLDRLPYGHGLMGPEAAARGYFGVAAKDLSWARAAYLAVLPRAPSMLDPYRHPERVLLRQQALLHALHEAGELSEADLRRALLEPVSPRPLERPFLAPHLVESLRTEGRLSPGATTTTTLDLPLQRDVEGLVHTHMARMVELGAGDTAVLVIDNATAEVLAYVGSTDFHDPAISGQVDMARAPRQPGSTLKPFVYALAFEAGRSPLELLPDVPTRFREGPGHVYAPHNYHGEFTGPVSAREALATSLNVPAVRLAAELPPGRLLDTLHRLGLHSLTEPAEHYGLALALGSGEVGLRELAEAYVALARGGEHLPLRTVMGEPAGTTTQVLDPAVAAAVTEALSDPLARTRLLPAGHRPFDIGFPVALKTGTSSGYRDAWTVGYTRERTVAVWLGNADNGPMHEVTGAGGAGPLFADVMRRAMRDVPTRAPLFDPGLLEPVEVCALSGHRPGPACEHTVTRRLARGNVPDEPCPFHVHARTQAVRTASASPFVCDPEGPEIVAVFPEPYTSWLDERTAGAPGHDPWGTPWLASERVPGCASEGERPGLAMVEPADGAVLWAGHESDAVELRAELQGTGRDPQELAPQIELIVDGEVVATTKWPYRALVRLAPGDHEVHARVRGGDPLPSTSTRFSVR